MDPKFAVPIVKSAAYLEKIGLESENYTIDYGDAVNLTGARITHYTPEAALRFTETVDSYSVTKDGLGKFIGSKPLPDTPPKELTDKLPKGGLK